MSTHRNSGWKTRWKATTTTPRPKKRTFHVFSTLTWEFHCCEWTRQTRYQQLSYVLFNGDFFLGGKWLKLILDPPQVKCRLLISGIFMQFFSIFWKCCKIIASISKKCWKFIASKMLEIKSWHLTWVGP